MNEMTKAHASKSQSPLSIFDRPLGEPLGWLRTEIDRLFDDFGRPTRSVFNFGQRGLAPVPALDMVDDEKAYHLTAELPGLAEKDIDISVADGVLRISGEKKEETERKEKGFLFSERRYGAFERDVPLPSDVNPDAIKAQFKDGVLTVTLAKDEKAAAHTRKITVEKA